MENFKSSIVYSDIYNRKVVEDIQKFHNVIQMYQLFSYLNNSYK